MTSPGTDAVVAQELGARLVHLSTDYVFGGEAEPRTTPYTEFDTPIPLSIYGKSKLAGENLVRHLCLGHFIIRTSGLFGVASSSGKGGNFIETMLGLTRERDELRWLMTRFFPHLHQGLSPENSPANDHRLFRHIPYH